MKSPIRETAVSQQAGPDPANRPLRVFIANPELMAQLPVETLKALYRAAARMLMRAKRSGT